MVGGICLSLALMLTSPTIEIKEAEIVEEIQLPEDFDYFCRCVEAEAENQGYKGKCLVADVILNRKEQWNLDSLTEVINQRINDIQQFEVVSNGRIWRVDVTEETEQACKDEIQERKYTDILFFRTKHYHNFGTPVVHHKDHFFSK